MISESDFKLLQSLSLDEKVQHMIFKIKEFYKHFDGKVFVSWSGGLDSTVLMNIARGIYPDIPRVFSNTGLEYPEIVQFVKDQIQDQSEYLDLNRKGYPVRLYEDETRIIKPKISYKKVIEKHGYPVISKIVSQMIYVLRHPKESNKLSRHLYLTGEKSDGTKSSYYFLPYKWRKLIDAPFETNSYCCTVMKKLPFRSYHLLTEEYPLLGIRAGESETRKMSYKRTGCNNYGNKPKSLPMATWTHQDVLQYILDHDLNYCHEIYGEILKGEDGKLYTTGANRTGCIYCMFGVHLESTPNRFQRLKQTHPKLWEYCMNDLGLKKVLKYIEVPYK